MTARWFVAQTHPRLEWIAQMRLKAQDFEVFLPTFYHNRPIGRGRNAELVEPLFPGYIFVSFTPNDRWRSINGTRGVSRLICQGDRPIPIPVGVIERLQEKANTAGVITDCSITHAIIYAAEEWLHITSGPFAGHSGICVESFDGSTDRIKVLLHLLGRETVVRIPAEYVTA